MANDNAEPLNKAILDAMRGVKGYVTVDHLARVTGSLEYDVETFIVENPEIIRKSRIQTDDGQSLFTLNTPLSGLADAWTAFRHVNSKKF